MKIYCSTEYQNRFNNRYKYDVEINSIEDFRWVVSHCDHIFSKMMNGWRKGENFEACNVLFFDIDNDSQPHYKLDDFRNDFQDYEFYIATSKSHQKIKNGKLADRFHIYFPMSQTISDSVIMKLYLKSLADIYFPTKVIDSSCIDVARFFFANSEAECYYNSGQYIDKSLEKSVVSAQQTKMSNNRIFKELGHYEMNKIKVMLYNKAKQGRFDSYDDWIRLGVALRASGFAEEDWLELSHDNVTLQDINNHWKTFSSNYTGLKITEGTLYWYMEN